MFCYVLQDEAAAKIQAIQRGKLGRQAAAQKAVELEELRRQRDAAAARIQAIERGRKGRREAEAQAVRMGRRKQQRDKWSAWLDRRKGKRSRHDGDGGGADSASGGGSGGDSPTALSGERGQQQMGPMVSWGQSGEGVGGGGGSTTEVAQAQELQRAREERREQLRRAAQQRLREARAQLHDANVWRNVAKKARVIRCVI